MSRYIPFPAYYDDMPIDISFVFRAEKPAGKHGFMKVNGSQFVFEDGTPARFWGVNFNGGACFPSFEYSEKVASRLAKTGVNIVRFHQLDAEWNTPNIFSFSKGERIGSTLELHPESMKRLDYLIKCLKEEGIYVYLDMNTYRNFKSGDGVENPFELLDAADPYCYYNPRLIELQKKYIHDIWNHVNPYTGLAYKDDPVIVMSEIINERDFFARQRLKIEPYVSEFRELFRGWCKEKGLGVDVDAIEDLNSNEIPELVEFKIEIQINFYKEMYAYMRKVGVKIPICGTNWNINGAVTKSNQIVNDYMDTHTYYYDWKWGERTKCCMNRAITQAPTYGMEAGTMVRALDRPLFVSEWDMPWPNEFRAESSILYAAVGALQGWSGWAIHTYAYGTKLMYMNILGKEVSSNSIGGVPYREGIFSTWNDPAKYGLFYHAALIARRGDVKEAPTSYAVKMENLVGGRTNELFAGAAEYARTGVCFDGVPGGKVDHTVCEGKDQPIVDMSKGEITSETGEMYRSWTKNYGTIDTGRTKVAYGFLAKNGEIGLKGLSVKAETDFAVVALSSLTDADIEKSDNMLLSTVGRARNTDARFEGEQMYDYGKPPITIEVIEADIALKTDRKDLIVWAVNAEGYFVGKVPARYEDGCLKFTVGKTMPSAYYLIQAE
ncbi:MAG: cellulase family glycosylhydrolase [Clostridia bacterium]|nr:cellulase family glycosylhydrolase [Clostridia bacterium]